MVMQSIDLADELECENTADGTLSLSCDQPGLSCGDDNLIIRAARLLREQLHPLRCDEFPLTTQPSPALT